MLVLVQRPQHKSTSDSVGAPKTNYFSAILIEFGDTKKCYTFLRLELVPKNQQKANLRSQLHAQRPKMHSNPLGPLEKIAFVEKFKEFAICAILKENSPLWGIHRG